MELTSRPFPVSSTGGHYSEQKAKVNIFSCFVRRAIAIGGPADTRVASGVGRCSPEQGRCGAAEKAPAPEGGRYKNEGRGELRPSGEEL
jgi:hypothetical protein